MSNGDIFFSLSQRRDDDRNDINPIIEVFTKTSLLDLLRQILIGGRDESHIDLDGFRPSDSM